MNNNEFAGRFVEFVFGWVKVIADGLWGVFSGTGKAGGGFLKWIGEHWLPLLAVMLVAGIVIDWLVWIVRWRPYWLWFRKKRRVYDEQELDETYAEPKKKEAPARRPRLTPRPVADPLFDIRPEAVKLEDNGEDALFDLGDMDGEAVSAPEAPNGSEEEGKDDLFDLPEDSAKPANDVEWFDK